MASTTLETVSADAGLALAAHTHCAPFYETTQMRQLYEDLDALEMGIAGTIGMRPATVRSSFSAATFATLPRTLRLPPAPVQKKHAILNEHVVAKGIVVAQQTASRILVAHRDADGCVVRCRAGLALHRLIPPPSPAQFAAARAGKHDRSRHAGILRRCHCQHDRVSQTAP